MRKIFFLLRLGGNAERNEDNAESKNRNFFLHVFHFLLLPTAGSLS